MSGERGAPARGLDVRRTISHLIFILLKLNGRITRKQFWIAWIFILVVGLGLGQLREGLLGQSPDGLLGFLYLSVYLYAVVAIYGKRLHDIGKSIWKVAWPFGLHGGMLLSSIAMISLGMVGSIPFDIAGVLALVAEFSPLFIWIIFAFMVGVPEGTTGDNIYGEDPRKERLIATSPGSQ